LISEQVSPNFEVIQSRTRFALAEVCPLWVFMRSIVCTPRTCRSMMMMMMMMYKFSYLLTYLLTCLLTFAGCSCRRSSVFHCIRSRISRSASVLRWDYRTTLRRLPKWPRLPARNTALSRCVHGSC